MTHIVELLIWGRPLAQLVQWASHVHVPCPHCNSRWFESDRGPSAPCHHPFHPVSCHFCHKKRPPKKRKWRNVDTVNGTYKCVNIPVICRNVKRQHFILATGLHHFGLSCHQPESLTPRNIPNTHSKIPKKEKYRRQGLGRFTQY